MRGASKTGNCRQPSAGALNLPAAVCRHFPSMILVAPHPLLLFWLPHLELLRDQIRMRKEVMGDTPPMATGSISFTDGR